MAEDVSNTLLQVFRQAGGLNEDESQALLMAMKVWLLLLLRQSMRRRRNLNFRMLTSPFLRQDERRYHEDIFGITYRISETYARTQ